MYVGEALCGSVSWVAGKDVYDIGCGNGVVGEFVKIVQDNNFLTLAEVQAYGVAAPVPDCSAPDGTAVKVSLELNLASVTVVEYQNLEGCNN